MTEKKQIGTIDLTPTWQGLLPSMLMIVQFGPDKNRDIIRSEFERMAKAADAYNDMTRALKPKDMIYTDVHQIFDGLQFKGKIDLFFDNDYPVMWKVYELFNDHGRFDVEDFIVKLRNNFKISNDEAEYIRVIHTMIYGTRWHLALVYAKHPEIVKELYVYMDLIFAGILIDTFPNGVIWNVTGKDLIAEGWKPGPEMGKELEKRRMEWVMNL